MKFDHVHLFTDGACSGNPGPGGWGAILRCGSVEKELSGAEKPTTNNRMELLAVINGLCALTRPCKVTIHTDSQYVLKGATEWIKNWQQRDWKTAANKPVENQDLWQALLTALAPHKTDWIWVKGHSGHPENERADALARAAIKA